ncbi:unnamed protein product [Rotaria sp. Silwood2]|nr:unnamed protein product [Rotaria sp. Silwood2]CAF2539215.1 unnamed protein product [Rotaria sp. Silwood2]CAF2791139.1 unnamed protein product [Rotaria sp. Silwood2]CAF2936061.1 unnamed protein product [Rotaria sp. Silwood2]CAF4253450.1 unnamed protein product [Rotaria sp. Silwood2]
METQSNERQLILFDGDDRRMDLFNDIKHLSKIPSSCEFYIFCSETDPILYKVLNHISDVSQVRVRRSSEPISQRLIEFLEENINRYTFILIVCSSEPSYKHVFKQIWKIYKHRKLFVMEINNLFNITVKDILIHLRQHGNKSNNIQVNEHDQSLQLLNSIDSQQINATNDNDSYIHQVFHIQPSPHVEYKKKNKKNIELFVVCEIHCPFCNEDFPSKNTLKKYISATCPDMTPYDDEWNMLRFSFQ